MKKKTLGVFSLAQTCFVAFCISLTASCGFKRSTSTANGLTSVAKLKASHLTYTLVWRSCEPGGLYLTGLESINVEYFSQNGERLKSEDFVLVLSSKFTSQEISSSTNEFELNIPENCKLIAVQLGNTKLKNRIRLE